MDTPTLNAHLETLAGLKTALAAEKELPAHLAGALGAINCAMDNYRGEVNRREQVAQAESEAAAQKLKDARALVAEADVKVAAPPAAPAPAAKAEAKTPVAK